MLVAEQVEPKTIKFCTCENPFDSVDWETRSAQIKGERGELIFEQTNCEVPSTWSQLATNIVCSKYYYGELRSETRENSVRQLINRVARTIADWGLNDGYFDTKEEADDFYRELSWLCLHQYGAFNSPVWFNVGLYHQYGIKGSKSNWVWNGSVGDVEKSDSSFVNPQGSACFIQSVDDTMESIMNLATSEAMLFKFGSGTGTDLSTIRSSRELLSGGGTPSGPLSFMRVYDQIAAIVRSGGKTRRAAKMQSLRVEHPDIIEFIECKWKEEQKAHALIKQGYEANFNGEAYSSIMYQNANLSVRVTDDFMRALDSDSMWTTTWVTDHTKEGPSYKASDIMNRMAECAWHCGDPGVQYHSTINKWHTCPNSGEIKASNPCSEYMFLDDTACNLASVNLLKFRKDNGEIDVARYQQACKIFFTAQEILVDNASYPTELIARNSHKFRPLGLGYTNLGSYLMSIGLPYDSPQARGICGALTAIMHGAANLTSAEMAGKLGPFDGYKENREPFMKVMRMHANAINGINKCPEYLIDCASTIWETVLARGRANGFRNAQATVLAPTGTISFMMDCDTTGIEPDIALVKYKQLAGGGMIKIVNQTVPMALSVLGYNKAAIKAIIDFIDDNDTIEGAPGLDSKHLAVFDCSFEPRNGKRSIKWQAHVKMMAAAQPFLSGAISKTVNMPRDTTPGDIAKAYIDGWKMGLKALAIYRDGSKGSQPLSTSTETDKAKESAIKPIRRRLPDTRSSMTHKFDISGHEGYITVGLYPDGTPGELFIKVAKEGSTVAGLMDVIGTVVSMGLQYGVPLSVYIEKFTHVRFEPQGYTKHPQIRIAKSLVDYIFRWLEITFPAAVDEPNGHHASNGQVASHETNGHHESNGHSGNGVLNGSVLAIAKNQQDAPPCDKCGQITYRNGACYLCHNCGTSAGCS